MSTSGRILRAAKGSDATRNGAWQIIRPNLRVWMAGSLSRSMRQQTVLMSARTGRVRAVGVGDPWNIRINVDVNEAFRRHQRRIPERCRLPKAGSQNQNPARRDSVLM